MLNKILVLGIQSPIFAHQGYKVTSDPGDDVYAIVSDTASFRFAPKDIPLIIVGDSVSAWAAKRVMPDAMFVATVEESLDKLSEIIPPEIILKTESVKNKLIILTHSNKGGVGKTSTAVSIASTLSQMGVSTVLCDFDYAAPDVASFFNIKKIQNYFTTGNVTSSIVNISDNLYILPAPKDINLPSIKANDLINIVNGLNYSVVIGDTCPAPWEKPYMHGVFNIADMVYSIVDQSLFSLEETAKYAPSLLMMGVLPENIRIVVNKFNHKLVNLKKVEQAFCSGFKKEVRNLPQIAAVIPEGWEDQVNAAYKGKVLCQEEWQKTCREITQKLGISGGSIEEPKGFFKKLRQSFGK